MKIISYYKTPYIHSPFDPSTSAGLSDDLAKIFELFPDGTVANVEGAYKLDSVSQTIVTMAGYSFIGSGPEIRVRNDERANAILTEFNNNINIKGETIVDFFMKSWICAVKYGDYVWRVLPENVNNDGTRRNLPDLQMIPRHTLTVEYDPFRGWRKFVQGAWWTGGTYSTPNAFLRTMYKTKGRMVNVRFLDTPDVCLYTKLFEEPPMTAALPYIVFRQWILAFMRKFAERMWSPYIVARVGDRHHYPQSKEEMRAELKAVANLLSRLRNFMVTSIPGNVDLQFPQLGGPGEIFIKYYDKMVEETANALFSSLAIRQQAKVYRGNDLVDEVSVRFYQAIREKMADGLRRFYSHNLIPWVDPNDIEFVWPRMRLYDTTTLLNAIGVAAKSGVFKDARERRDAFAQIIDILKNDTLSDEDVERLNAEFITMNAPSQPGVSTVDAVGGSTQPERIEKED